jgi:hypothetical protein
MQPQPMVRLPTVGSGWVPVFFPVVQPDLQALLKIGATAALPHIAHPLKIGATAALADIEFPLKIGGTGDLAHAAYPLTICGTAALACIGYHFRMGALGTVYLSLQVQPRK